MRIYEYLLAAFSFDRSAILGRLTRYILVLSFLGILSCDKTQNEFPDYDGPNMVTHSILYPESWQPGFSVVHEDKTSILRLQDYSYAGYRNGEREISPAINTVQKLDLVADGSVDVSNELQAAIDSAISSGGGIIELGVGLFRLDNPIKIKGSNIVLRGAGSEHTKLWFYKGGGSSAENLSNITVTGRRWINEQYSPNWLITNDAKIGENKLNLSSTDGLKVGDSISITWIVSNEFKRQHNSEDYWYHSPLNARKAFFRRTISKIEDKIIHFKVPLRYPIKLQYTPAVLKAEFYAEENGIEGISISNTLGIENAWASNDRSSAILMQFCVDCWLRDVQSFAHANKPFHLRSHGIVIERSFRVSIIDCHLAYAEHLGPGGNGYLFLVSRSNEILIQDSSAEFGRHNFSLNWDFGTSGNVFLRIASTGGQTCATLEEQLKGQCSVGYSDFHHALAIANLFDNAIINDGLQVGNRRDWSSGAGQTGTENVFWNTKGIGEIYAFNQGMGYVIGTSDSLKTYSKPLEYNWLTTHLALNTEPEDFLEFLKTGNNLQPQSLYQDQLQRRLSKMEGKQ